MLAGSALGERWRSALNREPPGLEKASYTRTIHSDDPLFTPTPLAGAERTVEDNNLLSCIPFLTPTWIYTGMEFVVAHFGPLWMVQKKKILPFSTFNSALSLVFVIHFWHSYRRKHRTYIHTLCMFHTCFTHINAVNSKDTGPRLQSTKTMMYN